VNSLLSGDLHPEGKELVLLSQKSSNMKKLFSLCFLQAIASLCCGMSVSAQSGLSIHIGKNGIDVRPDAFASYYQAPADRIGWLQRENIPTEQWPLLFEIARAGSVAPDRVWELRRQRSSWHDVLSALNVPPSHFYYDAPANQQLSPPYGRAYGYYRAHPAEIAHWSDGDLVRLASVKYISDSTHRPAHEAVVIYENNRHFIHTDYNDKAAKQNRGHGKVKVAKQNHGHGKAKQKKNNGNHGKHGNKSK
jgi:hypothetical protein